MTRTQTNLTWMPMCEFRQGGFAFPTETRILGVIKVGQEEGVLYQENHYQRKAKEA